MFDMRISKHYVLIISISTVNPQGLQRILHQSEAVEIECSLMFHTFDEALLSIMVESREDGGQKSRGVVKLSLFLLVGVCVMGEVCVFKALKECTSKGRFLKRDKIA